MGGSALRPLELGDLIDTCVGLYRRHAVAFLMIAAAVALPVEAVGALFATALHAGSGRVFAGHWFGGSFFSFFATLVAAVVCMRGIGQAYLGGTPRWRGSVAFAVRRPGAVATLAGIVAVCISIGLMLLFLPGVYLLAVWSLAAPVFVFERRRPQDALRTSRHLVHDRFWPVLGAIAVGWLLIAVLHAVVGVVLAPLAALPGADLAPVYFVRTFVTNGIGTVLTAPFAATLMAVLYFDVAVRRDRFDPNALAAAVDCDVTVDLTKRPPSDAPDIFRRHIAVLMERKGKHFEDLFNRGRQMLYELTKPSAEGEPPLQFEDGQPVTIMFTDLEGSTAIHQTLGDVRAREILRRHDDMVRLAVNGRGGRVVKHTGDGLMACFSSSVAAVEAAVDIQRALTDGVDPQLESPLRVRIGMNAGEPVVEERDVFGIAVQVAARIVSVAAPGQILVSETVRDLASGHEIVFTDQGDVALKGFRQPFRLFEVRWAESRLTRR